MEESHRYWKESVTILTDMSFDVTRIMEVDQYYVCFLKEEMISKRWRRSPTPGWSYRRSVSVSEATWLLNIDIYVDVINFKCALTVQKSFVMYDCLSWGNNYKQGENPKDWRQLNLIPNKQPDQLDPVPCRVSLRSMSTWTERSTFS